MIFANNDRPGVMLASAAQDYVNRFAVRPGKTAVVFTNNDSAYQVALDSYQKAVTSAALFVFDRLFLVAAMLRTAVSRRAGSIAASRSTSARDTGPSRSIGPFDASWSASLQSRTRSCRLDS